ncbi:cobalamin biosynthesis protein CobG [Streptomyces sp. NPDC006551]|uniref:cobalamin biosynthesis protein CobG n=1 Tax=Streptomyces sp. NPDC006551 TaxID=3157178 RepID=UPI0033B8B60B
MLAAMPPTPPTTPNRGEPLIRDRGDACPGALRLHPADDGRLARLRLPAGLLTSRQVAVLAAAAEELGDGSISVTSRGNVELRGLGEGCGTDLAERLAQAGLLPSATHERVRNIVASPLAGVDGIGCGDVQLWARELDALLCARDWTAALSGRFLFAFDDGRGDVAGLGADVTLFSTERTTGDGVGSPGAEAPALAVDDGVGPTAPETAAPAASLPSSGPAGGVLVRVGRQVRRVAPADAARAALAAADAFLTAAREAGTGAWRVRELPEGFEPDLAAALRRADIPTWSPPEAAGSTPRLSPTGTTPSEAAATAGATPAEAAPASGNTPSAPAAPHPPAAEAPATGTTPAEASTATDTTPPTPTAPRPPAAEAPDRTRPTAPTPGPLPGVFRDPGSGRHAVAVSVRLGRLTADQLRALAPSGGGELRLTPWRGAVVTGFTDRAAAEERLAALAEAGLITRTDSPWLGVGACTGRPGCAKSLADVRADATPGHGGAGGRPVHFSGCERRCGHPKGTWVDVVATRDGTYEVDGVPTPRTRLAAAVATARTPTTR